MRRFGDSQLGLPKDMWKCLFKIRFREQLLNHSARFTQIPDGLVNTIGLDPSPSVRAASRISTARRHSGTPCSRFAFIRVAGIVHTRSA